MTKKEKLTAKTGRNEPCPCGSGKKYKKCCLESDEKEAEKLREEAVKASEKKQEAAGREQTGLKQEYREAILLMNECFDEVVTDKEDVEAFRAEEAKMQKVYEKFSFSGYYKDYFTDYMLLDCGFGKSDKTVARRFIDDKIGERTSGEFEKVIRELSGSAYSFYEVFAVRHESAELIDVFSSKKQIIRWSDSEEGPPFQRLDIIFARIAGGDGRERMTGNYFNLCRPDREVLGRGMERVVKAYREDYPDQTAGKDDAEIYLAARKTLFLMMLDGVFTMLQAWDRQNKEVKICLNPDSGIRTK